MANFHVDIYFEPHKPLRNQLFELSMLCTKTDFQSIAAVRTLSERTEALFAELKKHAHHEDTYAHPIIAHKLPAAHDDLELEHKQQHQELEHLSVLIATLGQTTNLEDKQTVGREFYLRLNRFIAHYLEHLYQEERNLEILWQICQPAELFAIMIAFSSHEEPSFFPVLINLVKTHLSQAEQQYMFKVVGERLGANILTRTIEHAARILSPAEIATLTAVTR